MKERKANNLGSICIMSPRPRMLNRLRSTLSVNVENLYEIAKRYRLKMFRSSYWDNVPIVSVELMDVAVRRHPDSLLIVAEPRGIKVNSAILSFLLSLIRRGRSISMLEGTLGGLDHRIMKLYPSLPLSLGNFVLSDGNALFYAIVDYLDRHLYEGNRKSFVERGRQWASPRVYKGLSVPDWAWSGNEKLIEDAYSSMNSEE